MKTKDRGCLRGLPRALEDSSPEAYPRHAGRAFASIGWIPMRGDDSVLRANWPGRVKKTERNAVVRSGWRVTWWGPVGQSQSRESRRADKNVRTAHFLAPRGARAKGPKFGPAKNFSGIACVLHGASIANVGRV